MNPHNTGGEVNQADDESTYITEASSNNLLNPVDYEFPINCTPSERPTSFHAAQNHNCWRFGESSPISAPSDQINSNGMNTNHQLPQDEPSFSCGSSSNPMAVQHVNMDMDRSSYGSLGSSIQAAGESRSSPVSSSCKRKALEESHYCSGETPGCGGRPVATNAFHSTRNTETLSRPDRRVNPVSLEQNLPSNSTFIDPLDVVHLPAMARNIHRLIPAERFGPAINMRNRMHDQSIWSFTREEQISRFIPPQRRPPRPHNPSRTSELSSLFRQRIDSQSFSHGSSLPLSRRGPSRLSNELARPSGSNSRRHRSGLLTERQNNILQTIRLEMSLDDDTNRSTPFLSEMFSPYTSSGLSEDFILRTMKQHKHTSELHIEEEEQACCCICQEDYEEGEDVGSLECGHEFHTDCIKQWLFLKNLCPIYNS